jgi:hypothetical protein
MSHHPHDPRSTDLPGSVASAAALGILLVLLVMSFVTYAGSSSGASPFSNGIVITAR